MNEEIKAIFDEWGRETVIAIQAMLTAQRNVATGNLRASIRYQLGENFIQFTMNEYGKFVDEGTRPHWAPKTRSKSIYKLLFNCLSIIQIKAFQPLTNQRQL